MIVYNWKPIEDLPSDWRALRSSVLEALAETWREQAKKLQNSDILNTFNERLANQWAIETGILENLYTIDRGLTNLLVERGLEESLIAHDDRRTNKTPEQLIPILRTHKKVLEGLFVFVSHQRELSLSYVKELHQALTINQETVRAKTAEGYYVERPLKRGDWKNEQNNPSRSAGRIHEYCPPDFVIDEMDELIRLHAEHEAQNVPPEIEAAWLHHRFTQIHPFQDGNGLVARALASLIFIRHGWFPLVIDRDARDTYLDALEKADLGDISDLVQLFSKIQQNAFIGALSLSHDVLKRQAVDQLIVAGAERVRAREQHNYQERLAKATHIATRLEEIAYTEFDTQAKKLTEQLRPSNVSYFANVRRDKKDADAQKDTSHYYRSQIVETARQLGDYFANLNAYRAWVGLRITEERQTDIILSYHALGFDFNGVMAVSAFIQFTDKDEQGKRISSYNALSDSIFPFSVKEEIPEIETRFRTWLNGVLLAGLYQWTQQL